MLAAEGNAETKLRDDGAPRAPRLPLQTLPGVVLSRSRSVGSRTCAQCWDEEHGVTSTCTFSEFASDMLRAGSWLQSYGLKEHDFCAILAQNSLRYLCVSFGAMSLGAISMNLN
jgi:acyl-CoA synthetase (AMP-forming)/AMP-acid ligase II